MRNEIHFPTFLSGEQRPPRQFVIYQYGSDVVFTKEPHVLSVGTNFGKRVDELAKQFVVGSGATVGFSLKSQNNIKVKDFTATPTRWVPPHGEVCLPCGKKIHLPSEEWIPLPKHLGIMAMYTTENPYPLNR